MRRTVIAAIVAASLALGMTGTVVAGHHDGCVESFDAMELYTGWEAGDGIPAPGVDAWWDLTVAGFMAEGLTVSEVAAAYGFETDVALYQFVLEGILAVDADGSGSICWKPFPAQQQGWPAFFFKVQDDKHL